MPCFKKIFVVSALCLSTICVQTTLAASPIAPRPGDAPSISAYQQKVVDYAVSSLGASRKDLATAYHNYNSRNPNPRGAKIIHLFETTYEVSLVAKCVLPIIQSDNNNGLIEISKNIVKVGRAEDFIQLAKRVLPVEYQIKALLDNDKPIEKRVGAAAISFLDYEEKQTQDTESRARMAAILYYNLSFGTDGKCTPTPELTKIAIEAQK